ncbi:MAG: hypothetical protein IKB62_04250 [Oscillospiraceae bacterium]|nr:hypothetical protein [Oscillospiraceae bacterium]
MNELEQNAVKELKNYKAYKIKIQNIKAKIKALEDVGSGISYDGVRVDGGNDNGVEKDMITRIDNKERLENLLKIAEVNIAIIDRALEALTADERKILTAFYIEEREQGTADTLALQLNNTRSYIYVTKISALKRFSIMISK